MDFPPQNKGKVSIIVVWKLVRAPFVTSATITNTTVLQCLPRKTEGKRNHAEWDTKMDLPNQARLHCASHSEMPHAVWERGRGRGKEGEMGRRLLCLSLFPAPTSTGSGRKWKQTFCPLLTDHSSHLSAYMCPKFRDCTC